MGTQDPPNLGSCTEPRKKELTLLHRLAPHVKWTANLSETINFGKYLVQTKTCGAGEKEHTHNLP